MAMPDRERKRILAIAREVRRHVNRKSGKFCLPTGLCGEASVALSARLNRAGIPHELWIGQWQGPIDIMGEALDEEFGETGEHRNHTWIEFPQYAGAVLDVTADQFSKLPRIWFLADKQLYHGMEKLTLREILEEARVMGIDPEEKATIPMAGPRFRRPPNLKVRVRNHLRHPPRSCLCKRSKVVDKVRRGLIRRLK